MATQAARQLHLRGALGAPRTEMWEGREHLVVPMVALMEGVIHAVNAKTAEFVSAKALTASVDRWKGHPIVIGHPVRDGRQISAHDPEVLAKHGCGFIRQAEMKGTKLGMEALIDPARLEKLGRHQLLADLRAGKGCEVSVGAFVTTNDKRSAFNGKNYEGEWLEIGPDHTALLPDGIGACSIEMGCGAHRAAEGAYLVTAAGFEALSNPEGINQYTGASGAVGGRKGDNFVKKAHDPAEYGSHYKNFSDPVEASTMFEQAHAALEKQGYVRDAPSTLSMEYQRQADFTHPTTGAKASLTKNYFAADPAYKAQGYKGTSRVRLQIKNAKGLSMNPKSLKARILALFDTPEQAASEEAAELVAYNSMRVLFDGVGDQWDEVSGLIDDLISDETEDPTETPAEEQAEEEVEAARLDSIRSLCVSMIGALQSIVTSTYEQQTDDMPQPSDPRYAEALRTAIGARNSAADAKTIQDMHDGAMALGAKCDRANAMRTMAAKDCPECDGTGQVTKGDKQMDCASCDGTGVLKTAELKAACRCEEADVTKTERIAALLKNEHNPINDLKALEANTDEGLKMLEVHCENAAKLKAAADKLQADKDAAEAALKAASAKQLTEEEFLKTAPESIRTLVADKKAQDAAHKTALIATLKVAAKGVYSDEELAGKTIDELTKLTQLAKVEAPVDYSGRAVPTPRAAAGEDYTPPDPYKDGVAALKTASQVN